MKTDFEICKQISLTTDLQLNSKRRGVYNLHFYGTVHSVPSWIVHCLSLCVVIISIKFFKLSNPIVDFKVFLIPESWQGVNEKNHPTQFWIVFTILNSKP